MSVCETKVAAGARLRCVRLATGFDTQRAMSDTLGVGLTTYSKWELGQRRLPNHILVKLKYLTGATADYLFFGDVDGLPAHLYRKLLSWRKQ